MGYFSEDVARYRKKGSSGKNLWLNPGLWSVACYRLGNWVYTERLSAGLRIPLKIISFLANKWCEVFMEMCIDVHASIGPGLFVGHIGGIHISPLAIIGKNCDITHRVTIGASAMGRDGAPVIGDDVYIGTGATIVGKIRIGNGAKIAANTLVLSNVPEGATVIGVPGRIVMQPAKKKSGPAPAADPAIARAD